jgi:hypothetical protein
VTIPAPRVRKIIAEFSEGNGILTLDDVGDVRQFDTPEQVWRWVQRRDARDKHDFIITELEWRNTPPGFVLPGD